jgi:asparagine synthetase B (glutamine-hydrolysing)
VSLYTENEVIKIAITHSKVIGVIVPKGRALYDYAYDVTEFARCAIIYGYVIVEGRKLSAKEVMMMKEDELHKVIKGADGSFLIIKVEGDKLYIATDWLGTRPIYYAIVNDGIVFSSCFWSILRFFKEIKYPIRLNDKAIASFLWLGRIGILDNWTFVEDVRLAPPGTIITYDLELNRLNFHKYYELQYEAKINDEELAAKLVYYALLKSVKQVLMILPEEMKRNLCLFLSGGLDSRVLAAILKNYIRSFKMLTFGTERCDEVLIARMVAKKLGITQIIESYDLNQLADYAYDIVRLSNGFDVINAAHVIHALKMLRKNNCHVFTSGFALDLTLGGSYMSAFLRKIKNDDEYLTYILRKSSVFGHKELASIIGSRLKNQLLRVLHEFKSLANHITDTLYMNRNDKFFLYTRVRRFTIYGSIAMRYHSDEILPTISRKFADVFTKIDPNLRINHKVYRKFLLMLNKNLCLIPYKSTWIPPLFPLMLWKAGYILQALNNLIRKLTKDRLGLEMTYFDFDKALRCSNWRKLLYETILNPKSLIYKLGYLRYSPVKNMVIEHLYGKRNNGEKLAYIMTLELTLREILDT